VFDSLFALKTELTQRSFTDCTLSVFKEPCGSQASNLDAKKTASILLGGVFNEHAGQLSVARHIQQL
jgi:hypothetical protein